MAIKNKEGNWIDPRGQAVPQTYVKPLDRKRDHEVEMAVKEALAMEARMKGLKKKIIGRVMKYKDAVEKETGVKLEGKGNLCLTNFSGDKQVEFSMNDIIVFDEKLQIAKQLINECINEWSEGANKNLCVIVNKAFEVDKKGKVNTQAILKLREINIRNAKWKRAMEMIGEAISITGTRQYLNIRIRDDSRGKFRTVNLNFSSM